MIRSMNVAYWVDRWTDFHPDKTAVICGDEKFSYLDLFTRMEATCVYLQSLGIEKGDRICVMLKNSIEFLELFLACAKLGIIFVPINFRLVGPEIQYIIKNSRPRLFVFESEYWEMIEKLNLQNQKPQVMLSVVGSGNVPEEVMNYVSERNQYMGERPFLTNLLAPSDPEEPHVIMYTSGTTGKPKGAVLSHRKTFFNCLNADIFFKMHTDDVMLIVLPMFHSGGLFIQTAPTLYKGATMVVHKRFDPVKVFEDIERYKVTKFLGVPTIYKALLRTLAHKKYDISSLQVCAIGGERTSPGLIKNCMDAGMRLRQVMGQTETSILLWASEEDLMRKPNTVGRPVFHAEVSLLTKDGMKVGPNQVGEIVVRGSIMMKEYWGDPAQTEETIKNGWLHTGDLAYRDEEGYYYIVDRVKDMYISGGENVYPKEVEGVLMEHPDVEEVAVVGVPDETWGEVGHAFVVPKKGATPKPEELLAFCQGRLAPFKWPKRFTFVSALPKTSLGKVQKYLLVGKEDGGFFNNIVKERGEVVEILESLGIGHRVGGKTFYSERDTVIFIHGAGGNSTVWVHQLEGLQVGYNLVALDLIGHGTTKGGPVNSISEYGSWLEGILEKTFMRPVVLAGHSMGGAIVMEVASRNQKLVKGLILLATGPRLKVAPQFLKGLKEDFENTVKAIMKYAYRKDVDEKTVKEGVDLMVSSGQDVVFNDFYACDNFDISERLNEINVPSAIIVGDQDKLTPIKLSMELLEKLKDSRLIKVKNAGHMLMMEQPGQVNREIQNFLNLL